MKFKLAVPVALAALGLATMAPAAQAATVKQIRQADFVTALSDTRPGGHYEVLGEGIHLWTDGDVSPTSPNPNKVAEYFALTGELPTAVSLRVVRHRRTSLAPRSSSTRTRRPATPTTTTSSWASRSTRPTRPASR